MTAHHGIKSRDLFIALDLGNVLTFVNESVGARELARLSGRSEAEALKAVFGSDRDASIETGRKTFEKFTAECLDRLGLSITPSQFRRIYESVLTPNEAIFPLVGRLMEWYRVGLCSNTSTVHWQLERDRLPFGRLLDPAIVSYEVGVMKPERRIYEELARRAGVAPAQVLFVDDRPENVAGARSAGLRAIQFASVVQLQRDLEGLAIL